MSPEMMFSDEISQILGILSGLRSCLAFRGISIEPKETFRIILTLAYERREEAEDRNATVEMEELIVADRS